MFSSHVCLELSKCSVRSSVLTRWHLAAELQQIKKAVFNIFILKEYFVFAVWYAVTQADVLEQWLLVHKSNLRNNSTIYSGGLSTWATQMWVNVLHVCVRVYVEWEWWVSVVICFYLSDPKPNSYASTNHINYTHILLELEEAMKLRNKTTHPSHYPLSSMCTIYALLALTCIHSFFTGEVLNL